MQGGWGGGGGVNLKGGDFPPYHAAARGLKIWSPAVGKSFWPPPASNPNRGRLRFKAKWAFSEKLANRNWAGVSPKRLYLEFFRIFLPP